MNSDKDRKFYVKIFKMDGIEIEVKQSFGAQGIMFGCYLIMAVPAIMYINLPLMKLFLPCWSVLYILTIIELIKKNDILKFTLRKDDLYIRRMVPSKIVCNRYSLNYIDLVRRRSVKLSDDATLNEFELTYFGKVIGRFNDSKYTWNQSALRDLVKRIGNADIEDF